MPTPPVSRPSTPPRAAESANESSASSAPSTPRRSRSPSPEPVLSGLTARGAEPGHEFNVAEFAIQRHRENLELQLMDGIQQRADRPSPEQQPAEQDPAQVGTHQELAGDTGNTNRAAFELPSIEQIHRMADAYERQLRQVGTLARQQRGVGDALVRQHHIGAQPTVTPTPPPGIRRNREVLKDAMTALDELDASDTTHFRFPDQHRLAGEVLMHAFNGWSPFEHEGRPANSTFLRGEVPSTDPRQLLQQVIYDVRSWSEPMPPTPLLPPPPPPPPNLL
jgi:hypothetical protein